MSAYYKKNYDGTWYLYPRIFLPKTHGVRSVSTGFENEDKCTSYVITDRCDACVCDECPVKKPLKSFVPHRLSRKPWHQKFKMLNWPFSSHSLSNSPLRKISDSLFLFQCYCLFALFLVTFILQSLYLMVSDTAISKKRCREKSKKSSSQDCKVMWVVSNPSFAGKQSHP